MSLIQDHFAICTYSMKAEVYAIFIRSLGAVMVTVSIFYVDLYSMDNM